MIRLLFLLVPLILPISLNAEDLVFADGSEWEVVSKGHQFAEGMAWDADGHFYFTDVPRNQIFRVDKNTGKKTLFDGASGRTNGIAFGPNGRLYGCASGDKAINAWDVKTGEKTAVNTGTLSNDIAILNDGTIFYTDPNSKLVWRLAAGSFDRNLAEHRARGGYLAGGFQEMTSIDVVFWIFFHGNKRLFVGVSFGEKILPY